MPTKLKDGRVIPTLDEHAGQRPAASDKQFQKYRSGALTPSGQAAFDKATEAYKPKEAQWNKLYGKLVENEGTEGSNAITQGDALREYLKGGEHRLWEGGDIAALIAGGLLGRGIAHLSANPGAGAKNLIVPWLESAASGGKTYQQYASQPEQKDDPRGYDLHNLGMSTFGGLSGGTFTGGVENALANPSAKKTTNVVPPNGPNNPPPAPLDLGGKNPKAASEAILDRLGIRPGGSLAENRALIEQGLKRASPEVLKDIAASHPSFEASDLAGSITKRLKYMRALSIGAPITAGLASYFAPDTAQAAARTVGDAYERNVPEPARNALGAIANAPQFGEAREMPSEQDWRRQLPEVAARTDALDAQRAQERKAAEESRYSSILDAVQRQAPDEMSGVRRMTGSIAGLHPAFQGAAMNALAASPQANPHFAPQDNQPQNALAGAFAGGVPSNAFAPQGNPQQQTQAPSPIQRPQSIPAEPQEAEAPPRPTPKVPEDYEKGPLQRKQEKMIENALRQKEQERMMQNELALQGPDGNFYRALQAFQQHFAGAGAAAAGAR